MTWNRLIHPLVLPEVHQETLSYNKTNMSKNIWNENDYQLSGKVKPLSKNWPNWTGNYFQLLCVASRPSHPEGTSKYNSSAQCLVFFWQLQPSNKGRSAKQSKLLMETRTAPGFSLEYRSALLSFPQHAGILFSFVAEVTARRFCGVWCSCPSSAAATDWFYCCCSGLNSAKLDTRCSQASGIT